MAFPRGGAQAFNIFSIQNNCPNCSGVYGISNSREWILVAETNDIRGALLAHLREAGTALASQRPTGFNFEVVSAGSRGTRQREIAKELRPRYNTRG